MSNFLPDNAQSLYDGLQEVHLKGRQAFGGRAYVEKKFNRDVFARAMLDVFFKLGTGPD